MASKRILFVALFLLVSAVSAQAQVQNTKTFRLDWTDNAANEEGFYIYRDGAKAGQVGVDVKTWSEQVTGAVGRQVCYAVSAFNHAVNPDGTQGAVQESAKSNTACAAIPAPVVSVPGTPSGLTLSALTSSSMRLTWDDVDDETNYEVFGRSAKGPKTFAKLATLPADSTTYDWFVLKRYTSYCAKVRGTAGAVIGDFSPIICATTLK